VTHERLVAIAREVFSECGYDGTTFQEVARRAGLSRPTLHYHFGTKRAMYHDVFESTYTDVVAPAINRAAQETGLARQLTVFMEAVGEVMTHDWSVAAFLCLSAAECHSHPQLRDPDHCAVTATRRFMTWALNDAVGRGELPYSTRVEPLVDTLAAMLSGIGFFAAFVGTTPQTRGVIVQMQQLVTGKLWPSTE
jgi:AcrR family transcriptional regulator